MAPKICLPMSRLDTKTCSTFRRASKFRDSAKAGINVSLINTSSSDLGTVAPYHPRASAESIVRNTHPTKSIEQV